MAKRSLSSGMASDTSFGSGKGPPTVGSALAATCPTLLGFCQTQWLCWQASPFQQDVHPSGTTAAAGLAGARGGRKRSGARKRSAMPEESSEATTPRVITGRQCVANQPASGARSGIEAGPVEGGGVATAASPHSGQMSTLRGCARGTPRSAPAPPRAARSGPTWRARRDRPRRRGRSCSIAGRASSPPPSSTPRPARRPDRRGAPPDTRPAARGARPPRRGSGPPRGRGEPARR